MGTPAEYVARHRTGIEVGTIVSITIIILGLAFNAGVQYERINDLGRTQDILKKQYNEMHDSQYEIRNSIDVRLDHVETILVEIQATQKQETSKR